jgi:N-acetylmuramoyl-L-alanine amidase
MRDDVTVQASGWLENGHAALCLTVIVVLTTGMIPRWLAAQPAPTLLPSEQVMIIVLDPGHGGDDAGVRGPSGLLEKDITLQVATEAARLIEQLLGLRAILTRTDDSTVPLETRAARANQTGGDLFLSIHTGGSFAAVRREFQTYYFEDARGPSWPRREETRARAQLVRSSVGQSDVSVPPQAVLWDDAQREFLETSPTFARLLSSNLRAQVAEEGRGVFGLPLLLLRWIRMPAVLVELGSLRDPTFEAQLRDDAYLQRVALGIAQAVNDFHALQY